MSDEVSDEQLVDALLAWLRKRGEPDSGIDYSARRNISRGAECTLFDEDADFVVKHFHGQGARNLADALAARINSAIEPAAVASSVLGDENDLQSVAHALDIGGIGTPYRAYQGSLYCDYQPHRIADFQDYGLALAATVLFNNAKAIKAALASPISASGRDGE